MTRLNTATVERRELLRYVDDLEAIQKAHVIEARHMQTLLEISYCERAKLQTWRGFAAFQLSRFKIWLMEFFT